MLSREAKMKDAGYRDAGNDTSRISRRVKSFVETFVYRLKIKKRLKTLLARGKESCQT